MKNYITLKKPKYRINKVLIVDNTITVKHSSRIKPSTINFIDLFDDGIISKNEMISELSDICGGYCNEYLKNKIKTLKAEYTLNEDDRILYDFNKELENNFDKYVTIYNEYELSNIIINFGKSINTLTKIDFNAIYDENQDVQYIFKKSYYLMIEDLKIHSNKLEQVINKLIYKVGVLPKIERNTHSSNWNSIIYISLLCYLYREAVLERINLKFNILLFLKNIIFNKLIKLNSTEYEIIKFKTDCKEIKKIKSIIYFVFNYMENHYYYMNYYDNWYSDHLVDELEDFRQYLLLKTKSKEKRVKIEAYSYEKLNSLLRRKKLNY